MVITACLCISLWILSALARHEFGWHFFVAQDWDPVFNKFGALPFVYGTLVTSAVGLFVAVPLGLGAAIFLAELAPRRFSDALTFLIDLLAAVPSVIYGLLGVFILVPLCAPKYSQLSSTLSDSCRCFRARRTGLASLRRASCSPL